MPFDDPLTRRMVDFLADIGIPVQPAALPGKTFLPGLEIRCGAIRVDEARFLYPGDLLHEAGHLAVSAPEARAAENPDFTDGGEEMAAIAWSFAAARALDIPSSVVFHEDGYRGGSAAIVEAFETGGYFGHPLLQCWGMTLGPKEAAERGLKPYPAMLRWLR